MQHQTDVVDHHDLAALDAALARDAAAQTRAERATCKQRLQAHRPATFAQALAAVGEALL